MFFSREKEIQDIRNIAFGKSQAVVIYGKRRVGKTTLIFEALKNEYRFIYFECIKDTIETNINLFVNECKRAGLDIKSYMSFSSFIDVFDYINSLGNKYTIVIDEYPYLKEFTDEKIIDSVFQNIIDNHLSNLNLVISGSNIKMMESVLKEGNPLFGRFKLSIFLEELNYKEASLFYPSLDAYDKIAIYSVFGGSPFINEFINPNKSLKENIVNTFLKEGSSVYNYADSVLLTDASNKLHAKRILASLANGKKKYSELEIMLDRNRSGIINRSLSSLVDLKIIKKTYPINKMGDSKKAYYEICDNVLRFFYTYVNDNRSQLSLLGGDAFYDEYISPSIIEYISHRFEEQARQYFSICSKKGIIKGIKNIGTYYYDDKEGKTNGEFDVAIETKDGYEIYEVKYLKNKLTNEMIKKEIEQINKIKEMDISKIGFVSTFGPENKDSGYDFISAVDLYK